MSDLSTLVLLAWIIQALGFGFVGDERRCGFYRAALASLLAGPLVALALVIASPPRPPMG